MRVGEKGRRAAGPRIKKNEKNENSIVVLRRIRKADVRYR
jgi:hypothetical protein